MANLGSLERAVMDVLWDAEKPLLVREILTNLDRDLAYTTVQTVTERLLKKGLLVRKPYRNAFRYSPAHTRDRYLAELMLDALSASTDRVPVLARFAQSVEMDDAVALLEELSRRTGQTRSTT
ncbi:BlaI/MecI/CopY family transcriptional regulator [Nonomuraea sp. NPDC050663]|nr:BlaI/MecI/CopY family transcriptional regulator [Nonomuraea soli]